MLRVYPAVSVVTVNGKQYMETRFVVTDATNVVVRYGVDVYGTPAFEVVTCEEAPAGQQVSSDLIDHLSERA